MTDDHLHRRVEELGGELADLRGEIGRLVEAVLKGAKETAVEAARQAGEAEASVDEAVESPGEAAGEPAPSARDKLEREVESAVKTGKRVLHELDEAAQRHPKGSLVVAFLAGLLISRILDTGRNR